MPAEQVQKKEIYLTFAEYDRLDEIAKETNSIPPPHGYKSKGPGWRYLLKRLCTGEVIATEREPYTATARIDEAIQKLKDSGFVFELEPPTMPAQEAPIEPLPAPAPRHRAPKDHREAQEATVAPTEADIPYRQLSILELTA